MALRQCVGPFVAYPQQGRPEGGSFGKGSGQVLAENAVDRIIIRMTQDAGVELAVRSEIRVFDKCAAFRTKVFRRTPFQGGYLADFPVEFPETAIDVRPAAATGSSGRNTAALPV